MRQPYVRPAWRAPFSSRVGLAMDGILSACTPYAPAPNPLSIDQMPAVSCYTDISRSAVSAFNCSTASLERTWDE
jgi:hypothetical protein